jgi:mannose-6-phosphate isomerase-like protein (cupin superfamily)
MSEKISLNETFRFDNEGFSGNVYVEGDSGQGFNALLVEVHGHHPRKRILEGNTRAYYVVSGTGTFILEEVEHHVQENDLFVIPAGGEYEYTGEMKLFEFNVSPDNIFGDQKL